MVNRALGYFVIVRSISVQGSLHWEYSHLQNHSPSLFNQTTIFPSGHHGDDDVISSEKEEPTGLAGPSLDLSDMRMASCSCSHAKSFFCVK